MSRIGILPIDIPAGVSIEVDKDNLVTVKGPKGELTQQVDKNITVKVEDNKINVSRSTEEKDQKAKHGLYRSLNEQHGDWRFRRLHHQAGAGGCWIPAEVKNGNNRLELSLGFRMILS